jgi:hypothetical protein
MDLIKHVLFLVGAVWFLLAERGIIKLLSQKRLLFIKTIVLIEMKITYKDDDKFNLNRKWIRSTLLIWGSILILLAVTQIFCVLFKPENYKQIVNVLGNKYFQQLFVGIVFFSSYYMLKISNRKKSN